MGQHKGNLVVDGERHVSGQVTGTTYVRAGGVLEVHGQLSGGLIIEPGGEAIIHGQVCRNVLNQGRLTLYGQVSGRILGFPPVNQVGPDQVVGRDLEVPFCGQTISWSSDDAKSSD